MAKRRKSNTPKKKKNVGPFETDTRGFHYLPEDSTKRDPVPLANIFPELIAKYGLGRQLALSRFQQTLNAALGEIFGWQREWDSSKNGDNDARDAKSVGDYGFFDKNSFRIVSFRAGTLNIEVDNAPLLSELSFYEREILRRFQIAMPEDKIRKIKFITKF